MTPLRRAWLAGMRPGSPKALRALLDQYSPHIFANAVPEGADAAQLERTLRPLLLPNDRVADIAAWNESPHFVAWLRRAWIITNNRVPAAATAALDGGSGGSGTDV